MLTNETVQERKIHKLNKTQIKQTTQNTAKQNYPGQVASYDTRPGNDRAYSTMLLSPHETKLNKHNEIGSIKAMHSHVSTAVLTDRRQLSRDLTSSHDNCLFSTFSGKTVRKL